MITTTIFINNYYYYFVNIFGVEYQLGHRSIFCYSC